MVLAALAGPAAAGPSLPCPDGPDPLSFRPGFELPGGDCAAADPAGPGPLAVAAVTDPVTGRHWAAVAWRNEAAEVWVAVSADGACSFGPGGGMPATLVAPGPAEGRPAVALRVDDGAVQLAVAWTLGGEVQARLTDTLDGSFGGLATLGPAPGSGRPALAAAPAPAPRRILAAWADSAAGSVFAAATSGGRDPASWSAAEELMSGLGAEARVAASADAAGAGGAAGLSVLALAEGGAEAWLARSDDEGATWSAPRRIDDGSRDGLSAPGLAAAADPGAADSAWTLAAWAGRSLAGATPLELAADAARHAAGVLDHDFDGVAGAGQSVLATDPAGDLRPVAAAGTEGLAWFAWEEAGEVQARRLAVDASRPALSGGCGPFTVTGLDPPRGGGAAAEPAVAALGRDLLLAWVDDRRGWPRVWIQRADSRPPALPVLTPTPSACGENPSVAVAWGLPACDVVSQVLEVGTAPGGTDFTRDAGLDAAALVEGLLPGTSYWFRLRVTDSAGHEVVSEEVSADVPSCSEALLRTSVAAVADACPFGGAGGDGVLDPGETATLTLRVRNDGTVPALAPRLRLLTRSGELLVRTGGQDLPDLGPGETADAVVEVDLSTTSPCGASVEALARLEAEGTRWAELLDLGPPAGCTPCSTGACSVNADASATAPTEICNGDSATLDAGAGTAGDCAGVLLHEWWDGADLVGTSSTETVSPGSTRSYRLVTCCSTELDCSAEDTVEIFVNPLPGVGFVEDPPPPHCEGETITLRATTGDPAASFAWDGGEDTAAIAVSAGGVYRVTVTDSNGCVRARSWRVDFGPTPLADAGPDPDASACAPVRVGTPAAPLLDYSWDPVDGLSDPLAAQPEAAPAAATTYTLTVTDPLSGCTASDEVFVDVNPPPPVVSGLRVSQAAGRLEARWAAPAGRPVRLYSEEAVELARRANAGSATAVRLCEGSDSCDSAMPGGPLLFLQAVAACEDGLSEGPN